VSTSVSEETAASIFGIYDCHPNAVTLLRLVTEENCRRAQDSQFTRCYCKGQYRNLREINFMMKDIT
jgi:hypothetical protein